MKCFIETNKILTHSGFSKFARIVHEGFVNLNSPSYQEYLPSGEDFNLTIKAWINKCNEEAPKKIFSGEFVTFREYAAYQALNLVQKDYEAFQKNLAELSKSENNAAKEEFLMEAKYVLDLISKQKQFVPLKEVMTQALEGFIDEVTEKNRLRNLRTMVDQPNSSIKLRWCGGVASLGTLFHELRTRKSKKGEKYLDNIPSELEIFIFENFVDENGEPFSKASLKTYLDPNAKKAKRDNVDLQFLD